MSESVSNVEIEDVLSSIRRLVSEENRPAARRDSDDIPRKPSRLVLTPSLLVPVPDVIEPSEESTAEAQDDQLLIPESDADIPDPGQESDEMGAENTAQEKPEDTGDVPLGHKGDSVQTPDTDLDTDSDALLDLSEFEANTDTDTDWATVSEADAELELSAESESEAEPEIGTAPETDSADDPDIGPAPWRDPETTLFEAAETLPDLAFLPSQSDVIPEEGASAPDDADAGDQPSLDADDETAATVETKQDHDQPVSDGGAEPADPDPFNTATLSAKIAVLEAKIGETQDQWEPDGETDDEYAGTPVETIQWQDHTDEDATEDAVKGSPVAADVEPDLKPEIAYVQPPQAAPVDPADEPLDFLPEDETILDEESLRELVADIVRQELQGALGERITRNVRKLVRREIHRALTAQELD